MDWDFIGDQKQPKPLKEITRQVTLSGQTTSLAELFGAVCVTTNFDRLFGYSDELRQFRFDYTLPEWVHYSRVNRRLPVNRGKPQIWFGMGILEGNSPRLLCAGGVQVFPDRGNHRSWQPARL